MSVPQKLPLTDLRILNTRQATSNDRLGRLLTEQGAEVLSIPTIALRDPPSWSDFDEAAGNLSAFDWMILTSAEAVKRTQDRLKRLGIGQEDLKSLKIAAVGAQTAKKIESLGLKADLVPADFQAEGLLEEFEKTKIEGQTFFFPRALVARDLIIEWLTERGAKVNLAPVYENVVPFENRDRLKKALFEEKVDWVVFTSSSTVTNFLSILGTTPKTKELPKIASIGKVTTQTLEDAGLTPAFTAVPQNFEGILQGILDQERSP